MSHAMPGEPDYVAALTEQSYLRLVPQKRKKGDKLALIPSPKVAELCTRLLGILNSTDYTNSQKIAMMRIETRLLQEAVT